MDVVGGWGLPYGASHHRIDPGVLPFLQLQGAVHQLLQDGRVNHRRAMSTALVTRLNHTTLLSRLTETESNESNESFAA